MMTCGCCGTCWGNIKTNPFSFSLSFSLSIRGSSRSWWICYWRLAARLFDLIAARPPPLHDNRKLLFIITTHPQKEEEEEDLELFFLSNPTTTERVKEMASSKVAWRRTAGYPPLKRKISILYPPTVSSLLFSYSAVIPYIFLGIYYVYERGKERESYWAI